MAKLNPGIAINNGMIYDYLRLELDVSASPPAVGKK